MSAQNEWKDARHGYLCHVSLSHEYTEAALAAEKQQLWILTNQYTLLLQQLAKCELCQAKADRVTGYTQELEDVLTRGMHSSSGGNL